MSALTGEQIAQLAYQAGFRGEDLVRVVAIAKRESSYNPKAFNGNAGTGDKSYGLMQINMIGSMGPARMRQFGITSEDQLYDPLTNMKAAFALYKANGNQLTPWGGYKGVSDTHGADVEAARTVVNSAGSKGILGKDFTASASGGITAGQTAVGNMTDQDIAQFIASNYGFAAAYLNHAEIGPILIQAAREQWTPTKLQGAIMNTTWWKTTSASVRQFQQLAASDPTTAQAQIASRQSILSDAASKLGLSLAPDRLKTIAYHSLAFGWNQNQIDDALAEEVHYSPEAAQKGQIGANSAQVKALAAKYYLTVSDEAAFDYAKQLVTGQIDQGGIEATFISQAKGKFPTLAKYIDQGTTPSQFFSPYKSILAKEFDMPETAIDLANDPQFQPILSMAGQDGTLRPMSLSETTKWARTQPRWDATKGAKDQAAQFGEMLTSMFGATK